MKEGEEDRGKAWFGGSRKASHSLGAFLITLFSSAVSVFFFSLDVVCGLRFRRPFVRFKVMF